MRKAGYGISSPNDMKRKKILSVAAVLLLCVGCHSPQGDIPTGCWESLQGRPSLTLEKDSTGNYRAIVHHRTADGGTCPVAYPLVRSTDGMYIQAEGRIYVCYSLEDNTLFLSPGGMFQLKNDNLNDVRQE